ncbi:unnamed protein product, partial [Arabidopsis halleri]
SEDLCNWLGYRKDKLAYSRGDGSGAPEVMARVLPR